MPSRILVGIIMLLALTGCSVGPEYVRPELQTDVPRDWSFKAKPPVDAPSLATALPDAATDANWRWWTAFGDDVLNQLVDDALTYNNNLAAAAGRVLEARAAVGGASSAQWPSVSLGASASRSKRSEGVPSFGSPYSNVYGVNVTANWELDLWRRLAKGKEAAVATLMASEQDRRAVAQAVIADVVRTWLQIRELQLQVALNENTVENFQNNLSVVKDRYRRGLVSPLDVHLASQNLAAAQALGPTYRQNLNAARRRLEILAGRYPTGDIVTSDLEKSDGRLTREIMPDPLPPVPTGLPSQLLERRPDVLSTELGLQSSVARIGEAKAALYPRIALTAEGGSTTSDLADLLTKPTEAWSLIGNLVMPLINRGATKAQIAAAEARAHQATAQYRATVLQAFSEVENALDADLFQSQQEAFLTDSVEQARRSVNLADERYQRGLDNLLVSLESQRRLYTAESQLLTTQRLRRLARVDLIQALGGPWEETQTETEER